MSPIITSLLFPVVLTLFLYGSFSLRLNFRDIRDYGSTILLSSAPHPSRPFGCELVLEDHDLHHRMGWQRSHNYGKQTRLWDMLFGTDNVRIETNSDNVDWCNSLWERIAIQENTSQQQAA